MGISISRSHNVYIEVLVTTLCAVGDSDSVTIRNVKSISYYGWGDGIYCLMVCFAVIQMTVLLFMKPKGLWCSNITMQNSVLGADVAHPIFIGLYGNSNKSEVMEILNYVNIDILNLVENNRILRTVWLLMQTIIIWYGISVLRIYV